MVRDNDDLAGLELVRDKKIRQLIESANETGTQEYKKEVAKGATKRIKKNKRKVKNSPKRSDAKRRWMAGGAVLGIGIGGAAGYTIAEIPAYIEEAFESSLEAVKVEIAEKCGVKPEEVTILGVTELDQRSGGEYTTYTLYVKNEIFEYKSFRSNQSGEKRVIKDEIQSNEVLDAIATVVAADGGNVFDAMKANKLRKEIESGKIDLNMVLHERTNKALDDAGIER